MRYLYHGISLQNKRPSNMDSLLLKCGTIGGGPALLALVCDGVGSMADGAFASGEAARMLSEWFDAAGSAGASGATDLTGAAGRVGLAMRDEVLRINKTIIARAKERGMDTATTLSALLLAGSAYYIVHIGDSRIYCLDGGRLDGGRGDRGAGGQDQALSLLTHDDVSESGRLTACIGQTEALFPQYAEGDGGEKTFLLCSDGLYKRIDHSIMISTMKNWSEKAMKEPVEALAQYAVKQGERDNITVALARCIG